MNALQIAQLVLSVFSMVQPLLQPLEAAGVQALVNAIKQHQAQGTKMSFAQVHMLAAEHGISMPAVYARVLTTGALGILAAAQIVRAMRRKAA